MTERLHFHFDALEKEMATHSSVLAWRIPGTGEPGGLLSVGSHRVGHDWSDLAASILAWEIPWTEEPGGLQSNLWESQSVRYDWARYRYTGTSLFPPRMSFYLTLVNIFSQIDVFLKSDLSFLFLFWLERIFIKNLFRSFYNSTFYILIIKYN